MSDLIDRQAAIEALCNDYCGGRQDCKHYPKCENLKAVQNLPSAQPEILACGEGELNVPDINVGYMISRQAAIEALTKDKKALEHIINGMSGYEKEFDRFVGQRNQVGYDIYAIKQLPPAQPEPSQVAKDIARIVENEQDMRVIGQERIRGRWIPVGGALYKCDQCGVVSLKRKFCSECGADMREVTT